MSELSLEQMNVIESAVCNALEDQATEEDSRLLASYIVNLQSQLIAMTAERDRWKELAESNTKTGDEQMEMKRGQQMPIARLEVAGGGSDKRSGFVANVEVLPFNEPPEVIVWGSRIFKLHEKSDDFPNKPDVYRECFAWYAYCEVEA